MEPPLYDNSITLRENSHENEVSSKESEQDLIWSGDEFGKVFAVKNDLVSRHPPHPPPPPTCIMKKRVKASALEQSFSNVHGQTH